MNWCVKVAELLDVFDADMNPVPPYKIEREEAKRQGHWRQTFDCWVLRRADDGARIVIQLRSKAKSSHPGTFDISAAGAMMAGETKEDGVRELEEELGITADPKKLYYLGVSKEVTDNFGARNFAHTYFYETRLLPHECSPQASELDGVFEMKIADGLKLFSGEVETVEIEGTLKDASGTFKPHRRSLARTDMCGAHDRCVVTPYYLKIFILADLYLKGHRPLAI